MSDIKKKGSKEEVYEGKALCTSGGLKKDDLCLNKSGKVVSKKRSEQGKKAIQNLTKIKEENKLKDNLGGNLKEEIKHETKNESLPNNLILPPNAIEEEKKIELNNDNGAPKIKTRKVSNRKIKNENPLIDEIKYKTEA